MNKKIIIIIIFVIVAACSGYFFIKNNNNPVNNTSLINNSLYVNNTTVVGESSPEKTVDAKYGYCAICGKALTYSEATNEYTQGKVCSNCAKNPYYYTDEGSKYANQKLEEMYPEDYNGINDNEYYSE